MHQPTSGWTEEEEIVVICHSVNVYVSININLVPRLCLRPGHESVVGWWPVVGTATLPVMPKGRRTSGRGGGGGAAVVKKKDRLVREALRRERKSGAYLDPADPDFRSFRDQLQAQGLKLHEVPADG